MGCNCNNNKNTTRVSSSVSSTKKVAVPADQAQYAVRTFLPPYAGESYLNIRDKHGIIRYKIMNNTLTVRYIEGNEVLLKIGSENKIIKLDFPIQSDAMDALILLSDRYNLIRSSKT